MSEQRKMDGDSRRRQILRGIASGSGIAGLLSTGQWTEPVVRAVSLPAHAATSAAPDRSLARFSLTVDGGTLDVSVPGSAWFARQEHPTSLLDFLVPRALAMGSPYRRMVLVELPGQRFQFTMLENRHVSAGCIEESLIFAQDIPLFTPTPADRETCAGEILAGPEVEVIDVLDSEVTIRLDFTETFTLVHDPLAEPMISVTPCPCIGD